MCHLEPFLCPRQIWDISLRLGNADTDGWQRLIQLQLGPNKQPFKMKLKVESGGGGGGILSCCTDRFLLLNERGSRQVTQNAVGSQDDSDISGIWERKQIGIIKIQHTAYKFISLFFSFRTYIAYICTATAEWSVVMVLYRILNSHTYLHSSEHQSCCYILLF